LYDSFDDVCRKISKQRYNWLYNWIWMNDGVKERMIDLNSGIFIMWKGLGKHFEKIYIRQIIRNEFVAQFYIF
jgi:hypothetical protein